MIAFKQEHSRQTMEHLATLGLIDALSARETNPARQNGWNDEGNLNNSSGYLAETAPVPEPGTITLMGLRLLGLAGAARKQIRK